MVKNVIFFHGGSEEDYEADAKLAESLTSKLGPGYSVHYPLLPDTGEPDLGRRQQISHEISAAEENVLLVGHSLGASMLLVCVSESQIRKNIAGIFLLATPFWNGNEDWVEAFKLKPDFSKEINKNTPLFFYHCRDDKEVPFDQMATYKKHIPWATFREIKVGGHQFNNDLTLVAEDIKSIGK